MVFSQVVEYPLAVILACVAAPRPTRVSEAKLARVDARHAPPLVVFLLTAMLATNQAGLAESVIGVMAIMIASGLGLLATV